MKCKVVVSFLLDEDDSDMAEIELESHLSDLINNARTTISSFEVVATYEIEEEDDE